MNEDVLKMIDTLHARLDDLRDAVVSLPSEAPEYVQKLDKIDDKLYLLQCEIEKLSSQSDTLTDTETDGASVSDKPQESSDHAVLDNGGSSEVEEEAASAKKPQAVEEDAHSEKAATDESTSENSSKSKELFSDDMKENLADAGRAIGNIYRDGKEVITELSGTMGDLKDIFSFGKKR